MDETTAKTDGEARRLANLKPFPKGVSGNPKGRPRDIVSQAYRRILAKVDKDDAEARTYAEVLAEQMIIKAKGGDVQAMREITDRVEGKAKQTVTLSYEKREKLEAAVQGIIEDAQAAGVECSREEAINVLSQFTPEVSELLN